jgi:phosphopentomutase
MIRRAAVIVLDGVGIGAAHDAARYGDLGSDTLGNLSRALGGISLPHLERLGLGCVAEIAGVPPATPASGAWGAMEPSSPGKDSTTGHWELMGLHLAVPFPVYPEGFPPDLVSEFARRTGRAVIGNIAASGTAILDDFAAEHVSTGAWILYTSADSVFQIAAHEDVVPLAELYAACEVARSLLVAPHDVSRVIARPFMGTAGAWQRTANRRDYSIAPPGETLLDALAQQSIPRTGVGKIDDLFASRSIHSAHTRDNTEGMARIADWAASAESGFLLANLVDFDTLYGHRNDVAGFYRALRQFDDFLPRLLSNLREDDLLAITADHGNDPTTSSTDHARERVPVLATGAKIRPTGVGVRATFSDLGATIGEWFGLGFRGRGVSFLPEILA